MIVTPHEVHCDGCSRPVPRAPLAYFHGPYPEPGDACAHVRLGVTNKLVLRGSPCPGVKCYYYPYEQEQNLEDLLDGLEAADIPCAHTDVVPLNDTWMVYQSCSYAWKWEF